MEFVWLSRTVLSKSLQMRTSTKNSPRLRNSSSLNKQTWEFIITINILLINNKTKQQCTDNQ